MMMPPNHILSKCTGGDNLTKSQEKINHLMNISHSTNTLGKGMNPIILPPAMGK